MFAVLITGGGVQGISFALDLISVHSKLFVTDKKIGILTPKKTPSLPGAIFNIA